MTRTAPYVRSIADVTDDELDERARRRDKEARRRFECTTCWAKPGEPCVELVPVSWTHPARWRKLWGAR